MSGIEVCANFTIRAIGNLTIPYNPSDVQTYLSDIILDNLILNWIKIHGCLSFKPLMPKYSRN